MSNRERETGVWLVFTKGSRSFSANDALEESICFGWIDGVMKAIDEKTYKKYFTRRKDRANWSDKNQGVFYRLVKEGLMTEAGMAAYGAEPKPKRPPVDADAAIRALRDALLDDGEALLLFDTKPPSRQKQLGLFYSDAKTDATRARRLTKIAEALKSDYTGMLY